MSANIILTETSYDRAIEKLEFTIEYLRQMGIHENVLFGLGEVENILLDAYNNSINSAK